MELTSPVAAKPASKNGSAGEKDQPPKQNFWPLLAFLAAVVLFVVNAHYMLDYKKEKQFYEVSWNSRTILDSMINKDLRRAAVDAQSKDTVLKKAAKKQSDLLLALKRKMAVVSDTVLFASNIRNNLFITGCADNLCAAVVDAPVKGVDIVYKDSTLPTKQIEYHYTPTRQTFKDDAFFRAYPAFGFWAILILTQATFYSLLIVYLTMQMFGKDTLFSGIKPLTKVAYLLGVGIACGGLLYYLLYSGEILIKNSLFMANLEGILAYTNILGYAAAAVCFSGMFFCYIQTGYLKPGAEEKDYKPLESKFQNYFLIVTVILSVGIVATALLFSGINNMEFVKHYSRSVGKPAIPYELVYYFGLINTIMILAFYFPVNSRFDKFKTAPSKPPSFFTGPAKKLFEVIIASSPLLAGYLQTLLDTFFK